MVRVVTSCFLVLCFLGCAQNTETTAPQRTDQAQVTPTVTAQDQMTAGSDVRVYVINSPSGWGSPSDFSAAETGESSSGGRTFTQSGITVNVTTGGTTPTATGSSTGTASASQNPNQTQTVTPTQSPETSLAATAGLTLPGSSLSQQATAAGSGGTTGATEQTTSQTASYAQIKATVDRLDKLMQLVLAALSGAGIEPPASQPQ